MMALMMGAVPCKAQEASPPKEEPVSPGTPPECSEIKSKCEEFVKQADELIGLYQMQNEIMGAQLGDISQQLEASEKHALELKQRNEAWYRSPYLYLGIGLITGVIITK